MLVLAEQRLVFLEMPKAASMAVVSMLKPYGSTDPAQRAVTRHMGYLGYARVWQRRLQREAGGPLETFCVMREPLARLQSWYRYRMRAKIAGGGTSTRGISFEDFVLAYMADPVPAFARVGRQDRFMGLVGRTGEAARVRVDHVFDHRRIEVLVDFLSDRFGQRLVLPLRNVSPVPPVPLDYTLSEATSSRLRAHLATEFDLYDRLRREGVLHRTV